MDAYPAADCAAPYGGVRAGEMIEIKSL